MRHTRANRWLIGLAALALTGSVACERNEPAEVPAAQPAPSTTAATDESRTDGGITTAVQAKFFDNDTVKAQRIEVATDNGVVTLRGTVADDRTKEEAVRIARDTDGVTSVNDQLRIEGAAVATTGDDRDEPAPAGPSQPDAWLTAKIQSKYFIDETVKGRNIDVDTQDGVVTLKGTVQNDVEKRQALGLARNTDGVREVRDALTLDPTLDPVPGLPAAEEGLNRAGEALSDGWITTKIQSQYFLDDQVKTLTVNVDTQDGVVTLTGEVETDASRTAAESIAGKTEGVKKVVNRLVVSPR